MIHHEKEELNVPVESRILRTIIISALYKVAFSIVLRFC